MKVSRWIVNSVWCCIAFVTGLPLAVSAQNVEPEVEEIVVTGSRIKSGNMKSSQPISLLDEGDFAASGALTVPEALNELPQLGNPLEDGSNINSLDGFGAGTQTLNLRNLGADRTLVLVNGRRHVGGDVGTSSVDLNSIPTGLVERMEIITGAASAVYGADAVTGVVNIILKEGFNGTEIGARFGTTSKSDAQEVGIDVVHGSTFDGGDYVLAAEYSTQEPIVAGSRSFGQFDGSATTGLSGPENGSGISDAGSYDSVNLGGTGSFAADGSFGSFPTERFQRTPFRYLQNETDRMVLSGRGNLDLSTDVSAFGGITFANSKTIVQIEPQLGSFSDNRFGTSGTAGFRFPSVGPVSAIGDTLTIRSRRFSEFGTRASEIDRDLIRVDLGLEGTLGDTEFEVYYQYGRVEAQQTDFDTIDKFRLVTALDPVSCAATSGCQFVNAYGRNTIDPTSLSWISDDLISNSEGEQHVLSGYVSADWFDIAGNNTTYVLGAEYRREEALIEPNDGLIAINNPLDPGAGQFVGLKGSRTFFGDTAGDYDVAEVFGELLLPFGDRVNTILSARLSDYSTVGSEFTYSLSATFDISNDVALRGSAGLATRAPNIGELFAADAVASQQIVDPCDTETDAGDPLTPAAGCDFGPTYNPSNFDQNIRGVTGGNLGLRSETAETYTFGLVTRLTENFDFSVDYYSIDMEDVLATAFNAQTTLERCIASEDPFFCENVTRDPATEFVTSIRSEQVNLAEEGIKGVDLMMRYVLPIGNATLNTSINYSHLLEHKRKVNDTAATEDLAGRVDNIENQIYLKADYDTDEWGVGLIARYKGSAVQNVSADPTVALGNDIDSQLYLDLYGVVTLTDNAQLRVGIKNATDEESPIITGLFELNGGADTTFPGIYDVRGRFMYLNASYNF